MKSDNEVGIGIINDKIVIHLGSCTGWFGMSKEDAIAFAETIKLHAEEIPDKVGETD